MSLPAIAPPTREVVLPDGARLVVRGLRRRELLAVDEITGPERAAEIEIFMIACGTDTPADEVRAWYDPAPAEYVTPLMEAIGGLSNLTDGGKASGGD